MNREMVSSRTGEERLPGGSPMNLNCTTQPAKGDTLTETYTIVIAAPGAPPPVTPQGSTTLVPTNANVSYMLSGVGPEGNHIPANFQLPGSGVLVYKTP